MKLLSNFFCFVAGCDLDEEDKEEALDEEAEESGRKKTRLNYMYNHLEFMFLSLLVLRGMRRN